MSDFQQTITSLNLLHTSLYRMELFMNAQAVKNTKTDLISLISRLEKAERERDDLRIRNIQDGRVITDLNAVVNGLYDSTHKAERERDELRAEQAEHDEQIAKMESKFSLAKRALDSKTARCEKAEAELRRRDAAAGEPVAWRCRATNMFGDLIDAWKLSETKNQTGTCQPLYTTAPPAVLPPEKITEIMQDAWNEFCDDTGCYPDDFEYQNEQLFFDAGRWAMLVAERISRLGAQQQKAVICPPVQYLSKYAADDGHCTTGKLVPNKRTELRDTEWREALDAAGVKWEVKK